MNRIVMILALSYAISPIAAQKVHVDFDHACDFSRYKTYRWSGPPHTEFLNQLMQERVVGFVEEALAAKRLRRVETGSDLLVSLRMDVREQDMYTTFTDGWAWGGSVISTTSAEPMLWGTLTVDIVDSGRKQLVFQAVSSAPISSKPEKNTKRLAKSVNKMFEKYPPR